jgi:hypothetical protein
LPNQQQQLQEQQQQQREQQQANRPFLNPPTPQVRRVPPPTPRERQQLFDLTAGGGAPKKVANTGCLQAWDPATHMTRQAWAATCARVGR